MAGLLALMLHCHIPYCRKSGVWPAGEEWLFEALNETYVPLLQVLRGFQMDGLKPGIMIGVVPVLAEQLADPYMKQRFVEYLEERIRRAEQDCRRFQGNGGNLRVAEYWVERLRNTFDAFNHFFYQDVLGTLKWLQEEGVIEVLTSAATHGFLPLLERDSSVLAQIRIGVETYRKYFGRSPRGFWLPECAYRPAQWSEAEQRDRKSIDQWLADEGLTYFFVEGLGLSRAGFLENRFEEPGPNTGRGYRLPSGVSVFGRNEATGRQVWSAEAGYPGDPFYQEFHAKDSESGLHYWRVTGGPEKDRYDPDKARERLESHAEHFVSLVRQEALRLSRETTNAEPLIVSPYDGELFGHWWHEGPEWIDRVFRRLAVEEDVLSVSLGNYVEGKREDFSVIQMGASTWGMNGDFTVWLNPEHGWIWPYINACSRDLEYVLERISTTGVPLNERGNRILRQAAGFLGKVTDHPAACRRAC
ncbi:MAG: 1,4-alpha-glucan branching protein [Desulfobacterota bacterium]|nr:1,4-alpha-glucan branching protein [Thermodesulfobacteriota bacterium]